MDKVALVVYEPFEDNGMHPDLEAFYRNATFKNRVMFLTGQRSVMRKLFENSKQLSAMDSAYDAKSFSCV